MQILPSPAGSEDLLLNDFSTHLTLIIPLLKKIREEMRKSPHVVGLCWLSPLVSERILFQNRNRTHLNELVSGVKQDYFDIDCLGQCL